MSRRRRRPHRSNHERWLVSYADFITLLFAFFVVMYSTAQVDKRQVGRLALAIQVAFQELGVFPASTTRVPVSDAEPMPLDTVQAIENARRVRELGKIVPPPSPASPAPENGDLTELQQELERTLATEIARHQVALRTVPDGLVISLREIGFYDVGAADIQARSLPAFAQIVALLQRHPYRIRIEGHTDNTPIHNSQFASNWELSTSRATQLVRLLITQYGFAPQQLAAAGYAEFHPVADNATAEGRAQNRRVDMVVLGNPNSSVTAAPGSAPSAKPDPRIFPPAPR